MSNTRFRAAGAAGTVILSAATGLATNILTDHPSWAWAAGTATLVLCGALLATMTVVFESRQSPLARAPDGQLRLPPAPEVPADRSAPHAAAQGVRNTVIQGDGNRVGMPAGFVLLALLVVGATAVAVLGVALSFGPTGHRLPPGNDSAGQGAPAPAGSGSAGPSPTSSPSPEVLVTLPPTDEDIQGVEAKQCVERTTNIDDDPRLEIVRCRPGVYYVLRRIGGPTTGEADATRKCAPVRNYGQWYFYDSEDDALDFVLCLRPYPSENTP